jgi:hypothetical protein
MIADLIEEHGFGDGGQDVAEVPVEIIAPSMLAFICTSLHE